MIVKVAVASIAATLGVVGPLALGVDVLAADVATAPRPGARIVGEWEPGHSGEELGGRLLVDGYGIGGLGAYSLRLDDATVVLAVCVQADVGHSLEADYVADASPAVTSAELDYLLWRHLPRRGPGPSDDVAAAINALSWRYTNAQRSSGGPVWRDGDLEVAVVGHGRLPNVERAIGVLHAEASANRGPWSLGDLRSGSGPGSSSVVSVRLSGPGGPIADRPVTFRIGTAAPLTASTGDDGVARATLAPDAVVTGPVVATAEGPGPAGTYSAAGSQRLAVAGRPVALSITLDVPPPTTIPPTTTTTPPTTTTTTTAPPTTTTAPPTTLPPSTIPPTTTTTTVPSTTTTTVPSTTLPPTTLPPSTIPPTTVPPTTVPPATTTTPPPTTTTPPPTTTTAPGPPPTLPRTGSAARSTARWASLLFAVGSLGVLGATSGRRRG